MDNNKENLILDLSFNFSLKIIEFSELLNDDKKFTIAKQLIRSGTSIGANIREAQYAESKADFIHKLKIAEKEAHETEYWLLLCKHSKNYPYNEELITLLQSIIKILSKIILTSKTSVANTSW